MGIAFVCGVAAGAPPVLSMSAGSWRGAKSGSPGMQRHPQRSSQQGCSSCPGLPLLSAACPQTAEGDGICSVGLPCVGHSELINLIFLTSPLATATQPNPVCRDLFTNLDKDKSNSISSEEMVDGLRSQVR